MRLNAACLQQKHKLVGINDKVMKCTWEFHIYSPPHGMLSKNAGERKPRKKYAWTWKSLRYFLGWLNVSASYGMMRTSEMTGNSGFFYKVAIPTYQLVRRASWKRIIVHCVRGISTKSFNNWSAVINDEVLETSNKVGPMLASCTSGYVHQRIRRPEV